MKHTTAYGIYTACAAVVIAVNGPPAVLAAIAGLALLTAWRRRNSNKPHHLRRVQ